MITYRPIRGTITGTADVMFTNGDIVTMSDWVQVADALAVKNGRILSVGSMREVLKSKGPDTKLVDLQGRTLLPGFLDGHSHFSFAIRSASWVNVSPPPVGTATSIAQTIAHLRNALEERALAPGEWLIGYGYDGSALSDRRDALRQDLDPHFPDNPVMLVHVSMHGAVLNTAAFEAAGIDIYAAAPAGGFTARYPGSDEAAGLIMENSFFSALRSVPAASEKKLLAALDIAQERYASYGYTTVQDAPCDRLTRELLRLRAESGDLLVDVVAYVDGFELAQLLATKTEAIMGDYDRRLRIGGIKIVVDGSPQGRTAYFTDPYLTSGPAGEENWCGVPVIAQEDLNTLVRFAYDNNVQVLAHCNGDAAIDMLLNAHKTAGAPSDKRTVIVHSQFPRDDQLDAYARYGMIPSFFTNHAFFWGDVHVRNLGRDRAFAMSPTRSALERGITYSNHSDYAVTPLDPLFMLWTSVARQSRSGAVIGPNERLSVKQGLRALTIDAAFQYGEERAKGSLDAGKLADMVVLERNPAKCATDEIKTIRVVETYKEGACIYRSS